MAGLRLLSAVTSLGNRVPVNSVIRSVGAKGKERGAPGLQMKLKNPAIRQLQKLIVVLLG